MRGLGSQIVRAAGHPAAIVLIAACAPLLNASSLALGRRGDDYVHRELVLAHLREPDVAPGAWYELYGLRNRDGAAGVRAQVEAGRAPWWTDPGLSMALLRPLSAATHYLDYLLWPDSMVAMHLHSLAWYALLILCVGLLYRQMLGHGATAALATLLYAVDDAHAETAGWLAARNTSIAAVWAVLALLFFNRGHRGGRTRMPVLAPLCLALALLSSEGALAVWAYFIGHACLVDRSPYEARVRRLAPLAFVTALWLLAYRALGFGARGGGVYVDPLHQPLAFLAALPGRWTTLALEQFGLPKMIEFFLPPHLHAVRVLCAALFALLLLWVAGALVGSRRVVAFWGGASLVAMLPYCTFVPEPRLLLLPGIGAFAALALVVRAVARRSPIGLRLPRGFAHVVVAFALTVHGPLAMALSPRKAAELGLTELAAAYGARTLAQQPIAGRTVFLVNTTNFLMTYLAVVHTLAQDPSLRLLVLGASAQPIRITRPFPDLMVLEPEGGYLLEPSSQWVRSPRVPFPLGYSVMVGPARVTVTRLTPDHRPARVSVHLPDMESDRYLWLTQGFAFAPFPLPAVGRQFMWTPDLRLPAPEDLLPAAASGAW